VIFLVSVNGLRPLHDYYARYIVQMSQLNKSFAVLTRINTKNDHSVSLVIHTTGDAPVNSTANDDTSHTIRQQLQAKRDELLHRSARINRDLQHVDQPLSQDFAEQATEMENTDVLHGINAESQHEIQLINRALDRLDQGKYHQCVKCGSAIGDARLVAVPYAEHCISCAS
jgi:DnaK suppressor protein